MNKPSLLFSLLFLCLFTACAEPQADVSSPKTHKSGDLTFNYPKNWKITDDSVTPEVHYLIVESPGDAIVILQSYPKEEAGDLAAFAKDFSEIAVDETPIGKLTSKGFTDLPDADGYQWISEDFTISLLGETVPHKRLFGTKTLGDKQIFLVLQVATEDYSKTEAGFQLIQTTLRGL